jgi:hypothetical protein
MLAHSRVEKGMPRPPSDSVQVAIRIPAGWIAEADELAQKLSRPGLEISRTDAIRAAIARGFEVLREELDAERPAAPKKTSAKK